MPTLYEITNDLQSLMDLLESGAIDEQAFADTLESGIKDDADAKLESCAWAIRQLKAEAENISDTAKQLQAKAKAKEANAERIQASVMRHLTLIEAREAKAGVWTLRRQNNPVSVVIDESIPLPENFLTIKTVTSPNKEAIKEAIEAGGTVPGCSLVTKERLVIK